MAKKIFTYRGKTLEELQGMNHEDLMQLMPSRQRRKMKKGFSEDEKYLIEKLKSKNSVKTHLRDMIVLPEFVGKTIQVYTGQKFEPIMIQEEAIGCYLGELALSRKRILHSSPGVGSTKSSSKVSVR